jgi:hypothetical protein
MSTAARCNYQQRGSTRWFQDSTTFGAHMLSLNFLTIDGQSKDPVPAICIHPGMQYIQQQRKNGTMPLSEHKLHGMWSNNDWRVWIWQIVDTSSSARDGALQDRRGGT